MHRTATPFCTDTYSGTSISTTSLRAHQLLVVVGCISSGFPSGWRYHGSNTPSASTCKVHLSQESEGDRCLLTEHNFSTPYITCAASRIPSEPFYDVHDRNHVGCHVTSVSQEFVYALVDEEEWKHLNQSYLIVHTSHPCRAAGETMLGKFENGIRTGDVECDH